MNEETIPQDEQKNLLQRVLDIPLIGDTIALFLGLFPPYFAAIWLLPETGDEVRKIAINLLISFLIFIWNLGLLLAVRVNLTLPIIPIPLFLIGLVGVLFQIYRYFSI